MKVTLNEIEFTTTGDYRLLTPISGLFTPPIRTSNGNFSGRDGGWVSSQLYSPREIVLNASILKTCTNAYELLCALQNALPIRTSLPFLFTPTAMTEGYYADVFFMNMELDLDSATHYKMQITLLAPDPYFYLVDPSDMNLGWLSTSFSTIVGGGYVTPYILPIIWGASGQPTIVNNSTNTDIYPQIVLTGQYTNPRIVNADTGDYIELTVSTSITDTIIIDSKEHTVTLNGGSILNTMSGSWWPLAPGDNRIYLINAGTTTTGVIRYRPAYSGVMQGVC